MTGATDTAAAPTTGLLLEQVGLAGVQVNVDAAATVANELNPDSDDNRSELEQVAEPNGSSASGNTSTAGPASPVDTVTLARMVVLEGKFDTMTTLLTDFMSKAAFPAAAPANVAAPTNASSSSVPVSSGSAGLVRNCPAALLPDGGASLTNANFASKLGDLDAATKAMIAAGSALPETSGSGMFKQTHVLLPGHCIAVKGIRESAGSKLGFAFPDGFDDGFSGLTLRAASTLPGNGKLLSKTVLLERIPNLNKYIFGADKCLELWQKHDLISASEAVDYKSYVQLMRTVSEDFTSVGTTKATKDEAWACFLLLDQDLRLQQFDEQLPWSYHNGLINHHRHMKASAQLMALEARDVPAPPAAPTAPTAPTAPATGRKGNAARGASYMQLLTMIPEAYRREACVSFYTSGQCRRPTCKFAATGHKCFACGSTSHGTSQCQAPQ